MLAAQNAISPPIMTAPLLGPAHDLPLESGFVGQRQFKKHKVLPRPNNDTGHDSVHTPRVGLKNPDLTIDTSRPAGRDDSSRSRGTQPSSPRTLKHQSRRIGKGPDLPPTPPRHSRKSSSTSSVVPPSPTFADSTFQTPKNTSLQPPSTPPNQRSPPTPDVTPPQPATRPALLRPALGDRSGSKATTAGSHTGSGSFKTAREEPLSSEDEEKRSAVTKTSMSTVRHMPEKKNIIPPKLTGLGLAIASLAPLEDNAVSLSGGEFSSFDGDWSSISEVEQEWDNNLMRMVTIKKRPQVLDSARPVSQQAILVDSDMVSPTLAAKAVRQMPLHKKADTVSTKGVSDRATTSTAPSSTATSVSSDARRTSAISTKSIKSTKSTKSAVSTVVEAILVDGPYQPQRQRTLRHVRKQVALREPVKESLSSASSSVKTDRPSREPRPKTQTEKVRHESYISNTTVHSISSNKARREIWKNGGIPVVIVPDRRSSSNKPRSREPSLRSRSSRRTPSVGSVPRSGSSVREAKDTKEARDVDTVSSRQSRRSRRTYSESDGSDQRTMDFPPVIPARSSSLSAPTSRNTSRAGSLTADSIKMHNALQDSLMKKSKVTKEEPQIPFLRLPDESGARPALSTESDKDGTQRRLSSDRHSDFLMVKSYGSLKTPFSLASVETHGTALEVSEAMAVQMYPHQNSSVLMVDHSAKPSESSIETQPETKLDDLPGEQEATKKDSYGDGPVTPPQPQFSLEDVDSPLRNPRAPPEPPSHPPAINFIPATPSGMTPANEKMIQMGNYFETMREKPPRRPSLVRRALSRRRRHSIDYPPSASRGPGLLERTLSLSRHVRNSYAGSSRDKDYPDMERDSGIDDGPVEGDRLHPFWRPQGSSEEDECDGYCDHDHDTDQDEEIYRYPPINNRPQRNLSSRMKRTFAILPSRETDYYYADDWQGPERRTIRRTPSGNLRVMRHRASFESLRRNYRYDGEVHPVSDDEDRRPFWRRNNINRRASKERRRLSLGSRLEEIQNLPRKFQEKRREKRTRELRQKISGPREVRDGVGEVIRSSALRDQYNPNGRF